MSRRIAVLWHARQPRDRLDEYAVGHFTDVWRADGHEVINLFGTKTFVPADILIVHVDLSVVPQHYLRFARAYPLALNTRVRDIRKGTYSQLQVRRNDPWPGPVIVKTQRNHGGRPEEKLRPLGWLRHDATSLQRRRTRQRIRAPLPYNVYDHLSDVPLRYFIDQRWIVERFLPQRDDGLYYMHHLYVFGRHYASHRMSLAEQVVAGPHVHVEAVAPHPAAFAFVDQMALDYGKVDYVVHDGEAFLLDVNKTIGAVPASVNAELVAFRRARAPGVYDYFDEADPLMPRQTGDGSATPVRMQSAIEYEPQPLHG